MMNDTDRMYDMILNQLAVNVAWLSAKVGVIAESDDDDREEKAEQALELVAQEVDLMVDAVKSMFSKNSEQIRKDLYGKIDQINLRDYITAIQQKEQGQLN